VRATKQVAGFINMKQDFNTGDLRQHFHKIRETRFNRIFWILSYCDHTIPASSEKKYFCPHKAEAENDLSLLFLQAAISF
jgi:hypothetical protein